MTRNWTEFWREAVTKSKYSLIAICLVPLFFVLMNPDFKQVGYWSDLLVSTRIGIQISICYWMFSVLIYAFAYRIEPEWVVKMKSSIPIQIFLGIMLMMIGLFLTHIFEPFISGRKFGLQGVTLGALIGGITFLFFIFFVAYRRSQEKNLKLRAESAENSLHILKNQMQPHFLFNSLNSLSELIHQDSAAAANMTQKLADLYRLILKSSKTPMSLVGDEIKIVETYLELECVRLGERLRYQIEFNSQLSQLLIPSLLLQTLVENAIKHGVSQSRNGGKILLKLTEDQSHSTLPYRVEIKNTGAGLRILEEGTGLPNSRDRLNLIYGEAHDFKLIQEAEVTTASFRFSGR